MNLSLRKIITSLCVSSVLVFAGWKPAAACMNTYRRYFQNLKGEVADYKGKNPILEHLKEHAEDDKSKWVLERETLKPEATKPGAAFEARADYAAMGVYVGEVAQAIETLESLENEKPGEGIIASNLGTAYELNGNNEKALKCIKEGVRRNPNDHEGTEWLHVKILEAKLELTKDKDWLKTHSVLGLNFGTEPEPVIPRQGPTDFTGKVKTLAETQLALIYQLHERIYFVKPSDPIVADLLCDLACLVADSRSVAEANEIMNFALPYLPAQAELSERRATFFRSHQRIFELRYEAYIPHFLLFALLIYLIRNRIVRAREKLPISKVRAKI